MRDATLKSFAAAALAAVFVCAPAAAKDVPANALLVVPAETAFDRKFQDFLDKRGAKLLESHPPSVFVGAIPPELDKELEEKFGAKVYRGKVDDWSSFAGYGEKAVFAVNSWNKRLMEDPPRAPLVVSTKVQKTGRAGGLRLAWNEVMKAGAYRLQISGGRDFSALFLDTLLARNNFTLYPSFLEDGVYYWRVAPLVRLNTGEASEMPFSAAYTFAVSGSAGAARKSPAPPIAGPLGIRRGVLAWPNPSDLKYYRLQLSDTQSFEAPLADVFTDTCSYKMSGLPLEGGRTYYMRVMGSDGKAPGTWSGPAEVRSELPPASRPKRRPGSR